MLRLNDYKHEPANVQQNNSNTTNVKVKHDMNMRAYAVYDNSNTTNVKVKQAGAN